MFWGLSAALDLFEEYLNALTDSEEACEQQEPKEDPKVVEINILLFGSNDPRHVIKTMAKMYAHKAKGTTPIINFYMVDGCIEITARNILLLAIALEKPESINLRSKVHLFMDIYGNSLLRASSYQYLVGKAKSLLKIVTDSEWLERLAPILSFENLKYRERDGLENAFNFWLPKEGHVFKIQEYWCDKLRKLMGVRYDHRNGAFDWDLNMVLKDREGQQICSQEYRYWRETGIAFTYPEYEYSKPNKTLSAGLVRNGDKYIHRGYIGDMQTGPFSAFGLMSTDERLLRSAHGENDYRSTDVTERNLLELFHELITETPYEHNVKDSRKYGSVKLLMSKTLMYNECDINAMHDYENPWIQMKNIKINFLSSEDIFKLRNGEELWRNRFDVAFISYNYFAFLKDSFMNVLKEKCLLILETKLMSTIRKEDVTLFEEKLMNYAKVNNFTSVINYGALNKKHSILKYKRKKDTEENCQNN
uniref:Dynein assembly factor 3, axonemal homolog n=1 Tax=Glossina brevipalpis TaxID=37001 RepID=A0A1A9WMU6_9MUSC